MIISKYLDSLHNRRKHLEAQWTSAQQTVQAIAGAIQECDHQMKTFSNLVREEKQEKEEIVVDEVIPENIDEAPA
jgi:prefoldin subunit 5